MIVRTIKTEKITLGSSSIFEVLDMYLSQLEENSVVAVTSKIVSICEGRVAPANSVKRELVEAEADLYLPHAISPFDFTITRNTLIPAAGIDESNVGGGYVLWPKDPQNSANLIRDHLLKRFKLKNLAVIITDSTCIPLHWGTIGIAISYSGLAANHDYIGQPDLFGRKFTVSKSNIVDGLAAAAVLAMGEGTEQTPLAVIKDIQFVDFQSHKPTAKELNSFYISHMDDDLFAPFLRNAGWLKGQHNTSNE